jgi:hypothetical protein
MPTVHKYRIPAFLCSIAVLLCDLVANPFVKMGICDDGPYVVMAHTLATTGHIAYNGWATAMIGWQLYLGAAFIKLFGFSFTAVRMSTLLVAMALAFILQRTLVRAGVCEYNATLGTLAFVLSPLYLMLSVTFMTDIGGLFAIVLCFYACLRALQSPTQRSTILWLCFAIVSDSVCGTSRQIAWLGVLVLVPSTLWLLRTRRPVLITGSFVNLLGAVFVLACMQWFNHQPYAIPEHLLPPAVLPIKDIVMNLIHGCLEIPFLILPVIVVCIAGVWSSRRTLAITAFISLGYIALSIQRGFIPLLQPPMGDWVTIFGTIREVGINGEPPILLNTWVRVLITIASLGGLLGLVLSFFRTRQEPSKATSSKLSGQQLGILLGPFTLAYTVLLIPRAATFGLSDRYVLELAVVALFCLLLYYQEKFQPRLPFAAVLFIAMMAIYGIIATHNTFAFYRARVDLAAELRANGVPDTSVDHGWEYNLYTELQHSDHLNDGRVVVPANAYIPTPPLPDFPCPMYWHYDTPHIDPLYSISYTPDACYGPTRFAPMHYSRWPYQTPGTLYVVRFNPTARP